MRGTTARAGKTAAVLLAGGLLALGCSGSDDSSTTTTTRPRRPPVDGAALQADPCLVLPPAAVAKAFGAKLPRVDGPSITTCAYAEGGDAARLELIGGEAVTGAAERALPEGRAVAGVGDEARWQADTDLLGGRLAVRAGKVEFQVSARSADQDSQAIAKALAAGVAKRLAPVKSLGLPAPVASLADMCAALDPVAVTKLLKSGSQYTQGKDRSTCTVTGPKAATRATMVLEKPSGADAGDVSAARPSNRSKKWKRTTVDDLGDGAVYLAAPGGEQGELVMVWGGQLVRISVKGAKPQAVATGLARALGA